MQDVMQSPPGIAVALLAGAVLLCAGSPLAAQSTGTYAQVTLALTPEDTECASVAPDSVDVYTRDLNPRAVEWTVTDKDPDHAWVLKYADDKPGADAEEFGLEYEIPCGTTASVRSDLASEPGTWIYRVLVYACVEGEPSGEPVCTVDPEVVVKEPPPP